jgi:dolichyl-phosphate beta-glucosyltransferase
MEKNSQLTMCTQISIILPAYNEASRIGRSLARILAFVHQRNWRAEICVVDDGSSDSTAEVVRALMSAHPELRLLQNPGNRGKGYSVRNGMLAARGEILLFSDADLSSPIEESLKLIDALEKGADFAFGSRWLSSSTQVKRQSKRRQLAGRVYNLLQRMVLGLPYRDTQCGFKACTRAAAEVMFPRQRIERWGFDPELMYIARRHGLKMTEVPVVWANDDRSKVNALTDGFKMLGELFTIRLHGLAGHYDEPVPRPAEAVQAPIRPDEGQLDMEDPVTLG